MSKNIFFISDLHLGHENMCRFTTYEGGKSRNFETYQEADAIILKNWNSLVGTNDVVYILGDLCYACAKPYAENILAQLHGTKKLIGGNHDLWSSQWYLKYVKYIRGCGHIDNYFYSHVPIHPDSRGRFKLNIHGHIHNSRVMKKVEQEGKIIEIVDPFYYNVAVDLDYRYMPISFEEIQQYYQQCLDKGLLEPILPKIRK